MTGSTAHRPDATDFLDIFLNDTPMIDTRAPVEFNKGAFPGSVSLPLMTDDERALVGTCYKQQGQDKAITLGHELVSGNIKTERVQAWLDFAHQHPKGYLYCWRGGLRSQICQQWMRDADCDYPRITGGYKAMRSWIIEHFERQCTSLPMQVLAGKTGCDKTGLLLQLPNSVDLEGLANHLGSAFGKRPSGQPTQLNFENALAVAMLKAEHSDAVQSGLPVVLEDESLLIGRCSLPHQLRQTMDAAPLVVLDVTLEERVEHTFHNYILKKLAEWKTTLEAGADRSSNRSSNRSSDNSSNRSSNRPSDNSSNCPSNSDGDDDGNHDDEAFDAFANDLTSSLSRVQKRLGGVRYQALETQLNQALEAHKNGEPDAHRGWISALLTDYYDPMYEYQLSKREDKIVFRGNRTEVREFLSTRPE